MMQLSRERSAREQEREREEEAERLEREHRRLAEAVRDFLPLVCSENKCLRVEGRVGKHVTKATAARPRHACIPAADADGRHVTKRMAPDVHAHT